MATTTATRAAAGLPVPGHGFAATPKVVWGSVEITANPAAADVFEMCRIPKGAVVIGGRVFGDPLASTGSGQTLDIDVGFASDTDAFGNFGVWVHSAVAGFKPESGYNFPLGGLLITDGPQTMDGEKVIQFTVVASGVSTFQTGTLNLLVEYLLP